MRGRYRDYIYEKPIFTGVRISIFLALTPGCNWYCAIKKINQRKQVKRFEKNDVMN